MKVTIAYLPGEEREADILKRAACSILDDAKVRESDRHAPYRHIYVTSRRQLQNRKTVAAVEESGKEESPYV